MEAQRAIVLCGFMASGKTRIGRLLAGELGRKYVDTDDLLIRRAGMGIPEIFEKFGESHFRDLEHEAARELSRQRSIVIATGGGMLIFQRNVSLFRDKATIVHIHRDLDRIYPLLTADRNRPLAYRKSREEIAALMETRQSAYAACAHFTVDNNGEPMDCVRKILTKLSE